MHCEIPVLETDRLRLRAHRIGDFDDCAAMWADPGVTRYIGGKPSTRQQSWSRILSYVGHWSLMGFGYWAIEHRQTGSFVGELGFADFKRDMQPSIGGIPELGWALVSRVHGNGYATEAVLAVVAWGDENLASDKTVCIVHPENGASIRIAQKASYRELQRATFNQRAAVLFCRERSYARHDAAMRRVV